MGANKTMVSFQRLGGCASGDAIGIIVALLDFGAQDDDTTMELVRAANDLPWTLLFSLDVDSSTSAV